MEKEQNKTEIDKLKSDHKNQVKMLDKIKDAIEEQQKKELLGKNMVVEVTHNERFKNYSNLFSYLTKHQQVLTFWPIVSCIITYNSKKVVTVSKKNDQEFYVRCFNLHGTFENTFEEKLGGDVDEDEEENYIKIKEVEQNADGTKFAFVYFNDGNFYLRTFSDEDIAKNKIRSEEEVAENELDINEKLGLLNSSMSIDNFDDPFITCVFITDDLLYVNLFHTQSFTVHHFVYNQVSKQMNIRPPMELKHNAQNFPFKAFYNNDR